MKIDLLDGNGLIHSGSLIAGISSVLTFQNVFFALGTVGGLVISWLAFRWKVQRDKQELEDKRKFDDKVLAIFTQWTERGGVSNADDAPEAVLKAINVLEEAGNGPDSATAEI